MSIKKPLHNISTTINNKTSILIPNREHKQTNKQTNKKEHTFFYLCELRQRYPPYRINISDMMNDNIITIDKYVSDVMSRYYDINNIVMISNLVQISITSEPIL